MTASLAQDDLLRLRVLAQGLGSETERETEKRYPASPAERVAETARRMLAVQGQDWRSARWALGLRASGTSVDDVHEAFNRGLIVRSWPMRGTIHVLAAEDIGWMQRVTNRRILAGAAKRREILELDDATLDRMVQVSLDALSGGVSLDRDELSERWSEAGIQWKSNWRYHLIWWLCQNGLTVLGPVSERGEPRLVLAGEWITTPRDINGDEALLEIAARYASARGAVSAKDLAWWSALTAAESKRGLGFAVEAKRLTQLTVLREGKPVTVWADPAQLEVLGNARVPEWLLLPAFDEYLLGYQDRSPQLCPEHFARIVPGRNGMFLATIVRDGRVIGTWKKGTRKGEGLVGTPFPGDDIENGIGMLGRRAADWAQFHALNETPFTLTTATA